MTSWALRASVVIVLEAHAGQWCTLGFLAGRVIAPVHVVRTICDQLAAQGLVRRRPYYDEPIYGLQILDEYPVVNDVRDDGSHPGMCIGGSLRL